MEGAYTVAVELNEEPQPKRGRPNKSEPVDERGEFDRNAYQREYMRKWRAKRKAVKNP